VPSSCITYIHIPQPSAKCLNLYPLALYLSHLNEAFTEDTLATTQAKKNVCDAYVAGNKNEDK